MTIWQFLDKQLDRFSASTVAGCGIFVLTVLVLLMVRESPQLAENQLFSVLAQAIVVQGLVGLAMASWFTIKHGREDATGKPDDPLNVKPAGEPPTLDGEIV